jgi:hypothetical protein
MLRGELPGFFVVAAQGLALLVELGDVVGDSSCSGTP